MKRKFIQILMLLTIAVSVGTIVTSCKDTNEDLYNELKLQTIGNGTTTGNSLKIQIENLKTEVQILKDALAAIKQCNCDPNALEALKTTVEGLKTTIEGMKGQIATLQGQVTDLQNNKADKSEITALQNQITALQNQITPLQSALTVLEGKYDYIIGLLADNYVAKTTFENEIARLEALIAGITPGPATDLTEILNRLSAAEQAIIEAKATATNAMNLATEAKTTADAAKAAADAAQAAADAAKAAADAAQATADQAKTDAATAQATADAAKTTADAAKTLAETLQGLVNEHSNTLAEHATKIANIETTITTMSTKLEEAYTNAATAKALAESNKARIDALEGRMNTAEGKITNLENDVTNLKTDVANLQNELALANAAIERCRATCAAEIAAAKAELIGRINDVKDELNDKINDILNDIDDINATDERQDIRLDSIVNALKGLNVDIDPETAEKLEKAAQDIIALQNRVTAIENTYVTKEEFNNKVSELTDKIDANTTEIGNVKTALQEAEQRLQDQIDALKGDVDALKDRVKATEDAIEEINGQLDAIAETLKQMVTGIIIQGTDNPAFGSISLPTNTQTNVLIAYFGKVYGDELVFPTASTAHYVNAAEALTEKDMEMIGTDASFTAAGGDYLVENEVNNAGTLYLTINPNTVDYKGVQLTLENSQGKKSGIQLGKVRPSQKTLGFGWTRAANNGFYEVSASMPVDAIKKVQKVDLHTDEIKANVKQIVNYSYGGDFDYLNLAKNMYSIISDLNMDANAVKCEWTDGEGETHSVVSTYNLAATAVKPLSFSTLYGIEIVTVPGYERANALINRLANEVKKNIRAGFNYVTGSQTVADIQAITINNIDFELTPEQKAEFKFTLDTDFALDGLNYTLDFSKTVNVPIVFSQDVDLSTLNLQTPAIVVNGTGQGTLANVPVVHNGDNAMTAYHVDIDLEDVTFTATTAPTAIDMTGKKINVNVNTSQDVTINVNELIDFTGKTFHVTKVIPLDDLADEFSDIIGDEMGSINDMLDQLRSVVNDVNIQINNLNDIETQAINKVDGYVEKARGYLEKINRALVNQINNINARLQPVMLGGSEGVKLLSQAKGYPTVMKAGKVTLIPTTWTYELVVPVCKKHVAVTNVFKGAATAQDGDADCKAKLDAANGAEKMNAILDGSSRNIELTDLAAGYTYEVAYSAVDFYGKISTKKFYITIVE